MKGGFALGFKRGNGFHTNAFSPGRLCCDVVDQPVVIPSEREGSKKDFSSWSKQGFLPRGIRCKWQTTLLCALLFHGVEMTQRVTDTVAPLLRHSLWREKVRRRGQSNCTLTSILSSRGRGRRAEPARLRPASAGQSASA